MLTQGGDLVDLRRVLDGLASPADLAPSCPTQGMLKQREISHFCVFSFSPFGELKVHNAVLDFCLLTTEEIRIQKRCYLIRSLLLVLWLKSFG